jgi:putative flippase GtrA
LIARLTSPLAAQAFNFLWTGMLAAVVHYGTLIFLVERLHTPPTLAALAGYVLGGATSYLLNRRWTFRSNAPHAQAVSKFAVVAFVGFCLTGLCMYVFVDRFKAPYLPAQIVTTLVVLTWSFLAHRKWTFRAS